MQTLADPFDKHCPCHASVVQAQAQVEEAAKNWNPNKDARVQVRCLVWHGWEPWHGWEHCHGWEMAWV